MTINEKVVGLYQKIYKTDKHPDSFDLARTVSLVMQASLRCKDAEREVGKDVLDLFKSVTTFSKDELSVNVSKLRAKMNEVDDEE